MMNSLVEHLLDVPAMWVYVGVGLFVFAECAVVIGFIVPGQTAAIIGGVAASRGDTNVVVMVVIVVVAAICGDTIGYALGKHFGPRVMDTALFARKRARVEDARQRLAARGGAAVFLGRFVAFLRAVMPALSGIAHMPYRRFLTFNALGGVVWGAGYVALGFAAGNSYAAVAHTAGQAGAVVGVLVILGFVAVWRIQERRNRAKR